MLKAMTWSLFSGGFFAVGFAYVYARRAYARRLAGDAAERSLVEARARSQAIADTLEAPYPGEEGDLELDIELVDIDAMQETEEAYDATSPDDLGALWLARATQTSGAHRSSRIEVTSFDDEDGVDAAGRPTEPPQEPHDSTREDSSNRG